MNKAFVKESEGDEDDDAPESALPAGTKNYMTVRGHAQIRAEFEHLVKVERPAMVQVVSWAAGNGDRSENGDYIYGKKRLREIDRRIRFLTKRLESAVIVDPAAQQNRDQVFFAATVTVCDAEGTEETYQIVGIDEANAQEGRISWISPLARARGHRGQGQHGHAPGGGAAAGPAYAEALDVPFVFSSNGDGFLFHDRTGPGPVERFVALDAFPSPAELWNRYRAWKGWTPTGEGRARARTTTTASGKEPRYYQRIAVQRTIEAVAAGERRILLVMATGTGKTYTAFQIIWRLWKAGPSSACCSSPTATSSSTRP
jgi:transcription elongation factor GreB